MGVKDDIYVDIIDTPDTSKICTQKKLIFIVGNRLVFGYSHLRCSKTSYDNGDNAHSFPK